MKNALNYIHEKYVLSRRLTKRSSRYATDTDAKRIAFTLRSASDHKQIANSGQTRLVYVISSENKILYVGEAYSGLKIRLERGFSSRRHYKRSGKARKGYQGYKWADLLIPNGAPDLEVDAFIFGSEYNDDEYRCIIEGVEGELVYLVRKETGLWPSFQNEIHFSDQPGASEAAEEIYRKLTDVKKNGQ